MDAATAISLVVSIASLLVAGYVGIKQYTIQRNSNTLPAVLELLAQWQRPGLVDAFDFIAEELDNYDPDKGLIGLPPDAKAKVLDVSYFLQHVAMLIVQGVINEQEFTAFLRARTVAAWEKAGPFILKERVINPASGSEFMSLFEAFAAKARQFPPEIGQQIVARWLAKDSRGRIGPNITERIAGRQRLWAKAYSEAMGRSLLSESRTESNQDQFGRSDATSGQQEGVSPQ